MSLLEEAYLERITRLVDDLETRTEAEIVVAIVPQSGVYHDASGLFGALFGVLGLVFMVLNPWTVHGEWIPLEFAILYALGCLVAHKLPVLRRLFTVHARRVKEVKKAAASVFHDEKLSRTRSRTGLLVFYSIFERELLVIPDVGVETAVETAAFNRKVFELAKAPRGVAPEEDFAAGLKSLGELLAEALPPSDDNPDEIPNRPRTEV